MVLIRTFLPLYIERLFDSQGEHMFASTARDGYAPHQQRSGRDPMARDDRGDTGRISPRQQQILDLILRTVAERGYPPSVREIGDAVGLSSPSTVHSHLSSLVKAGYLRRDSEPPAVREQGHSHG